MTLDKLLAKDCALETQAKACAIEASESQGSRIESSHPQSSGT